jgi:phage-related tail protein
LATLLAIHALAEPTRRDHNSREGASMTTHIEDLQNLRATSVQQRRQLVRDLATPNERGGAQDVRDLFLKLQSTIEAIDRALRDEQADTTQSWPREVSR